MELLAHRPRKHPTSASLGSSAGSIFVELHSHSVSATPVTVPQNVELIVAVVGNDKGLVIRAEVGQRTETILSTGGFFSTPVAVDNQITVKVPVPGTLHLYLPAMQIHADSGACRSLEPTRPHIDDARLRRALDHISANLDEELTLTQLAQVAGISMFHFARRFTRAMGVSPSRYVSRMRLGRAMAEITAGKLCLAKIAYRAGFSSQTSFTRAFYRVTGMTPGEYRAHRG
jgi:AraC family transcriptional regulator